MDGYQEWLAGRRRGCSRPPDEYRPTPDYACNVDEGPIDLGYDEERGERHILYRKVHYYRGVVVWFSLQQTLTDSEEEHIVCRVDCCHSVVHRHVFGRVGGEIDRVDLVNIPERGRTVVDGEYEADTKT